MNTLIRKYIAMIKVSWSLMLEYRLELTIWIIRNLYPIVLMFVWLDISKRGLGPLKSHEIISYYLATLLAGRLTSTWVIWGMEHWVRKGMVAFDLLRPIDPIHKSLAEQFAGKTVIHIIFLPPWFLAVMLVPGTQYSPEFSTVLLFLTSCLSGFFMAFLLQYCFGLIAFWAIVGTVFYEVYISLWLFLSGVSFPLVVLPDYLRTIVNLLPFRYSISFPIEILLGWLSPQEITNGFINLACWICILLFLRQFLWKRAMKRFTSVGG